MYQVIGSRGVGKTRSLLEEAKRKNITIVCANPRAIEQKAQAYGIGYIKCVGYNELLNPDRDKNELFLIDELDGFLKYMFGYSCLGYSLTTGD